VSKGPHAADLLQKMLVALNVDPAAIAKMGPLVMRAPPLVAAGDAQPLQIAHDPKWN
jgi:hypothetical protein